MSSCSIAISKAKNAFKNSKKRAESLAKDMQVTREGEVLAETIANADYALEKLNAHDFTALDAVNRAGLVNNMAGILLRQELSDVFEGAISPNADRSTQRQPLVLRSASYEDGVLKVVVTTKDKNKHWEYEFEPNSNVSKRSPATGTRLFIPDFAQTYRGVESTIREARKGLTATEQAKKGRAYFDALRKSLETGEDVDTLLASTASGGKFNYHKASERKINPHGSIQDFKNILSDLHAIEGNTITDELFNEFNDLLDQMHPHFFRKMSVFINENAEHTQGWVNVNKQHILLNISSKSVDGMSNEEMYVHELIHAMTTWALNQEGFISSRLRNRLNYLRKVAKNSIKWQDLAKADPSLSEDQAKKRYDYIFGSATTDSTYSDDEFIAFALTNPAFKKLLKNVRLKDERETGFLNAVKDFFVDLLNVVMGNYDFTNRNGDVYTEIHALAFKLAEINARGDEHVKEGNMFSKISDLLDVTEGRFEEWAAKAIELLDSKSDLKIPENITPAGKVILFAKLMTKSLYNKRHRQVLGAYFTMLHIKPNNSIREVIRSLIPDLDNDMTSQVLGLKTNNIDAMRNTTVTVAATNIMNKFKKKPSEKEEVALTLAFLESNASALFTMDKNQGKGYSAAQVEKLLSDVGYRKRTIGRLEALIKRKYSKRANWVIGQAKGLGRFMATGKGHEAQVTNSASIVRGYGSNERFNFDKNLMSLVEELAALSAIDNQNVSEMQTAATLLKKEHDAVKNIVNLYNAFKEQSKEELFADDAAHMMEGYTKELFDSTIEIKYELLSDEAEMKKQGFKLISKVDNSGLGGTEAVGIYVSDTYGQAERLRGAVGLGNPHSRGLSLKEVRYKQFQNSTKHAQVYFEADKIRLNKKAKEIHEKLAEGIDISQIEDGAMPILNATGQVVDYRNMMDKHLKAKFLGQDRTVSSVLSKTSATVTDKVARAQQNKDVLKVIKQWMKDVHDNPSSKDNLEEKTYISAESADPELRQLFFMLPKEYQDFANAREDKSIVVPSVLMHQYFGYKHHRFTDLIGIKSLPTQVKRIINMIEAYWLDLVKIAKGNVLLKMPAVLVGNIVANILFAVNTGMPITEIFGAYRDSFIEVKAFMAKHKELEAKKIELAALSQNYMTTSFSQAELDAHNEEVTELNNDIARLHKEMNKSEVKELFDLGMYQAVVEDVAMYKLGDTNKISDGMDKLLAKTPTIIKTPLQWAYLSKETAWYKFNQEVLQLSDLIARDVMNRKQKQIEEMQADGKKDLPVEYRKLIGRMQPRRLSKPLTGAEREHFMKVAEQSRHANLIKSFVNYNLPNGKGEEYLNRIGLLMFTKYLKRIQQVITTSGVKHPIRTALTLAGASFMMDADMIQDQSLIVKGMDDSDFGLFGILPVYSPVDIFLNVATPGLVKLVPGV